MTKIRTLLAGESWISNSTHYKGWDFFSSTVYETGHDFMQESLKNTNVDIVHLPNHLAGRDFPVTMEALSEYDVVILSDIGANTLLLHPDTFLNSKPMPNRFNLLKEWVKNGGALVMCGGYYSFSGIYAESKYYRTAIEEILPVNIFTFDDRVEMPQGEIAEIVDPAHPILKDVPAEWPILLGLNELTLKQDAKLLAKIGDYPLLAVGEYGKGRTMIWASDIGPHWCPNEFVTWEGYGRMWQQAIEWLANRN